MSKKQVWVVGHRNPDTDSICAAIVYADLKNKVEERDCVHKTNMCHYVPKRAGEINPETAYVLNYFGVPEPEYINNVGTQIKDISYRRIEGVSSDISLKKAWSMMKLLDVVTLPVVNKMNKLEGIIVAGDIAKSYMEDNDKKTLSKARTQYKNIIETLEGSIICGDAEEYFEDGTVRVVASSSEYAERYMEKGDLLILGDNEITQMAAIESGCNCIVITNGLLVEKDILEIAKKRGVVIISTPYDSFTTARLIHQSMPISYIMTGGNLICYELDDYIDYVKSSTANIRHRYFPIVDKNQNYVGMFSQRNLINIQKKKLILVDHNEKSQAVKNVEQAEILEIIDHHRLGTLETISPVYFRNQPLGCTATIIYQIYQEKGIEIPKTMAGLLCAAIISDTLMFRSPTCTKIDKATAHELAAIAGIDIETFANHMFEAASSFDEKTEDEILNLDFKVFYHANHSFGISQISAVGQLELEKIANRIRGGHLKKMHKDKEVDMLFVMLTNILAETTELYYVGDGAEELVSRAFGKPTEKNTVMLKNVVSRKKQLVPEIIRALER